MTDTLRQLAAARVELEAAKEQLAERQATLEQVAIYHAVVFAKDWIRDSQEQIAMLTDQVRAEAMAAYQETGNKQPWPGVQVKMYTEIKFDEAEAWHWCRVHADYLLMLDVRGFKEHGASMKGAPVTITTVPKATITKDLSRYLEIDQPRETC